MTLSLFVVNLFMGQDFKLDSSFKEQYRFIDWERNRLDFYGESPAFVNFFKKIDPLKMVEEADGRCWSAHPLV